MQEEPTSVDMKAKKPYVDRNANALKRMHSQLGEKKVNYLKAKWAALTTTEEVNSADWRAADNILKSLITIGFSQIEIRSLFPVGGSRINRLTKELKDPETHLNKKARAEPWHSAKDEDRQRIRDDIGRYEFLDAPQCVHRSPKKYFAEVGLSWKAVWSAYEDKMKSNNHRVLSYSCWTQLVHSIYPELYINKPTVSLCALCSEQSASAKGKV